MGTPNEGVEKLEAGIIDWTLHCSLTGVATTCVSHSLTIQRTEFVIQHRVRSPSGLCARKGKIMGQRLPHLPFTRGLARLAEKGKTSLQQMAARDDGP